MLLRGGGRRRWTKQHWVFLRQLFLKLETISFCFVVEVSREMMNLFIYFYLEGEMDLLAMRDDR